MAGLHQQCLKVAHHPGVAPRQFPRNLIPMAQEVFQTLSGACVRHLAGNFSRAVEKLVLVALASP